MKDKKIAKICLDFGNLETIEVPFTDVYMLDIHFISDYLFAMGNDIISKRRQAKEVFVVFKPEAREHATSSFDNFTKSSMDFFDRLFLYNDVVGITLVYEDENVVPEDYVVSWKEGKNEEDNVWQKTFWQRNKDCQGFGGFCLHIGEKNSYEEMELVSSDEEDEDEVFEEEEKKELTFDDIEAFLKDKLGTSLYSFESHGCVLMVHTPFVQHNGDAITVYIISKTDGGLWVTDAGEVYNEFKLVSKERHFDIKKWEDMLKSFDVYCQKTTITEHGRKVRYLYALGMNCEENLERILFCVLRMMQVQTLFFGRLANLVRK